MDKEMIDNVIEKLKNSADVLYQGDVDKGMVQLGGTLADMEIIIAGISEEELQNKLMDDALAPILSAMEQRDGTEMADLITYELIPVFETLV